MQPPILPDGERLVAFDIDGTLADTRGLVRESYRLAGVDMPDHAWGLPWSSWLYPRTESRAQAVAIHARKTEIFLKLINDRPPRKLPAVRVAHALIRQGITVKFVTGASPRAARAILEQCQLTTDGLIGYSCTSTDKIELLKDEDPRFGLYVDDDLRAGQVVARGARYEFLHATHDDPRRMMEDVEKWMQ